MEATEITNSQDTLDSRDVEARIIELESELKETDERYSGEKEDLQEELNKLKALKEAIDNDEQWDSYNL